MDDMRITSLYGGCGGTWINRSQFPFNFSNFKDMSYIIIHYSTYLFPSSLSYWIIMDITRANITPIPIPIPHFCGLMGWPQSRRTVKIPPTHAGIQRGSYQHQ